MKKLSNAVALEHKSFLIEAARNNIMLELKDSLHMIRLFPRKFASGQEISTFYSYIQRFPPLYFLCYQRFEPEKNRVLDSCFGFELDNPDFHDFRMWTIPKIRKIQNQTPNPNPKNPKSKPESKIHIQNLFGFFFGFEPQSATHHFRHLD